MPPKKKAARVVPSSMAALRENLGKRYGDQVVTRSKVKPYEVISTGSLALDLAHRVGGFVEGRIHEIVGPEGSGKTTLVTTTMIEAQKKYPDKAVAYIDMEQTFDYDRAEGLGLKTDDDHWLHIFPDDAEDVSDVLRRTAETGLFSVVVVDSIGGMESKAAFDKDAEEKVMGNNAQVITRMVKHCAVICRRENVTALLVNQLRANLSGMGSDISAGPKAMKYATTTKTSMSILFGAENQISYRIPGDDEDSVIGSRHRARVTRSKVAVQGKKAEFWIVNYPTSEHGLVGIDQADEAITIGLYTGVIEQQGGGYYILPSPGNPAEVKAKKEICPKDYLRLRGRDTVLTHLRSCVDDLLVVREQAIAALAGDVIEEVEVEAEMVGAE